MTNLVLESRFSEQLRQGALGVELFDALRRSRLAAAVDVSVDAGEDGARLLLRRNAWMHGVLYGPRLTGDELTLRIQDTTRRFAPRRLRFPIARPTPDPLAPEPNPGFRIRPTFLYPGAAYEYASGATAIRGRVLRGSGANAPLVRWPRIEAYNRTGNVPIGRAHGDDRGEFLLLLWPTAGPQGEPVNPIPIDVKVFTTSAAAAPSEYAKDPLADLPIELVGVPTAGPDPLEQRPRLDPVAAGERIPATYTRTSLTPVDVPLGRVVSRTFSV
jgi:hypothetical protein